MNRMSLVSAAGFVGGVKEYIFRGIQQLPIVLASTSLIYTIATGSVVHANLALGLTVLMPLYSWILQLLLGWLLLKFAPGQKISWTRSTGDTCNLIPDHSPGKQLSYYDANNESAVQSVPSYWLMSVAFFIGYAISNGVDSLLAPAQPNADPSNQEKRHSHAIYVIAATSVLSAIVLALRFTTMRGCEGRGLLGIVLSVVAAGGAASIGYGMYTVSKQCGSRASDLFGILSQILPAAATAPHPVVCTSDY